MRCFIFIASLCLAVTVVAAPAELPPAPRSNITRLDQWRVEKAWFVRNYEKPYGEIGMHDPRWDAALETFEERCFENFISGDYSVFYGPGVDYGGWTVHTLAAPVWKAGCRDPMFLYLRAVFMERFDYRGSVMAMKTAVPALLASQYPACVKWAAVDNLLRVANNESDVNLAAKMQDALGDLFAQYIRSPNVDPLERRMKCTDLIELFDHTPPGVRARIMNALDQPPGLDPWLLHIAHGMADIQKGWDARGKGFADTVTPDGQAQFEIQFNNAANELTAAYVVEPGYPEAATQMINVSMGLGNDALTQMRLWFDRATTAQIDHMPAWRTFSWGLLPRWYGSHDAVYALALQAANTGRFDTAVPEFFLKSLRDIAHDKPIPDEPTDYSFFERPDIWSPVKMVFDGYLAKPRPGMDVPYYQSEELAFAYRCKQYDEAVRLLDILKNKVDPRPLADLDIQDANQVLIESFAMTSDVGPQVKQACDLQDAQSYSDALTAFERIARKIDDSHSAWLFVQRGIFINRILDMLASGKVATIPIDSKTAQAGWIASGASTNWSFNDGLSVTLKRRAAVQIALAAPLPRKAHTIIHFQWSYTEPVAAEKTLFQCLLGQLGNAQTGMVSVGAAPNQQKLGVMTTGEWITGLDALKVDMAPSVMHDWTIDKQGKSLTLTADGKAVLTNVQAGYLREGQPMIGFQLYSAGKGGATLQVRNLTVESHPLPN